jgi:hypothetical protein
MVLSSYYSHPIPAGYRLVLLFINTSRTLVIVDIDRGGSVEILRY